MSTARELRAAVDQARTGGLPVGLVPTMGYLHEGHLSLVDRALERTDFVVVSVFVNPLQFGEGEDLESYPRDLERDAALLDDRGVDLLFAPTVDEMYPAGEPVVTVDPGPMADVLCGAYRPGHFRGVLTVVAKLFHLARPDVAVFGRKDFQQAVLIRRMVADLNMDVTVEAAPIVREDDGLAMSSRNSYLSDEERAQAPGIRAGLVAALEAFQNGRRDADELLAAFRDTLAGYPMIQLQYARIVNPDSLEPVGTVEEGDVLAVAAHLGSTRLIDNVTLS